MSDMTAKHAHLEMLQDVINRLSHNSFLLKGWSVVLVSAMFALGAQDTEPLFVYLAYFPAVAFWCLDGYFLRQERLFRALYDQVRALKDDGIDFGMDTSIVTSKVDSWFDVTRSGTLIAFHGVIFFTILVVMVFGLLLI